MARFFQPLQQAVAAFFKHDIALRRAKDGVHIVLEERPARPGKTKRSTPAQRLGLRERDELSLICEQLSELLDELPETRQTMRHLVFVERALAKKGLKALHKLPLDVLQRGLEQLERLVTNWTPVGLASLRSKMAVAIIEREHMDPAVEAEAYRPSAVFDDSSGAELPEVQEHADDEALAAAYAALGGVGPMGAEVEIQGELGSRAARMATKLAPRQGESGGEIEIRVLSH